MFNIDATTWISNYLEHFYLKTLDSANLARSMGPQGPANASGHPPSDGVDQ